MLLQEEDENKRLTTSRSCAPDRAIHRVLLQLLRHGPEESREPLRAPPPYPSDIPRRPPRACSPLCLDRAPLVFSRSVLSISLQGWLLTRVNEIAGRVHADL